MTIKFVLISIAVLAGPAGAQAMYRCGNSFSQELCGPDAKVVKGSVPAPAAAESPADPVVVEGAKAACISKLKSDVAFKDPDSVRIGTVERQNLGEVSFDGKRHLVRAYSMQVNARNSYGGYTGEQLFGCYLDPAESRVLKISKP